MLESYYVCLGVGLGKVFSVIVTKRRIKINLKKIKVVLNMSSLHQIIKVIQ